MNKFKSFILFSVLFLLLSLGLGAKEYKAAVKKLPTSDFYASVVKAVVEATGNTVAIEVVPPARADFLISNKEVDIQLPIIVISDSSKVKQLKYDFSTVVLYKLSFVLYTNKSKPIDAESLKKGNPKKYKIAVDPSRIDDYNFQVIAANYFEPNFKSLGEGDIDGIILSQTSGDSILKNLKLTNIKRQFWSEFDLSFSIQKGARGGEIDKLLAAGVDKIKANGAYDKLIGQFAKAAKYDDWQP